MSRIIFHVDMDAFYASIEQRDQPEFCGKPVIIGSDPKQGRGRGVVAACSYEARRFGVHSAMAISRAYRLCPDGVYLRPDMKKYGTVSGRIRLLFLSVTALVQPLSIDEAFLDVSGTVGSQGEALELARSLKHRIFQEESLTASIGIAPSKFVAKIASDVHKPNGLLMIRPDEVQRFLDPLPVSRIWGVGPRTGEKLKRLKIHTIAELRRMDVDLLVSRFGKQGAHLWELANGRDDRPVVTERQIKSVSNEHTFEKDVLGRGELDSRLKQLSRRVSERLKKRDLMGRTVTLKLRYSDFTTLTRQVSLRDPISDGEEICRLALGLLDRHRDPQQRVRLIGVGVSSLATSRTTRQLELYGPSALLTVVGC